MAQQHVFGYSNGQMPPKQFMDLPTELRQQIFKERTSNMSKDYYKKSKQNLKQKYVPNRARDVHYFLTGGHFGGKPNLKDFGMSYT